MWFSIIGTCGVISMLAAYFLLLNGKLSVERYPYHLLNFAGASGIMISLYKDWNLSAFLVEVAWACVSIYGMWKIFKTRRA